MDQPDLPFTRDERDLEHELRALLPDPTGAPLEIVFGRSRRHPVQLEQRVAPDGRRHRRLRLNACFRTAPDEVIAALASWVRSGRRARRACATLDHWIASAVPQVEPRAPRPRVTRGQHHDLEAIRASVLSDPSAGPVAHMQAPPPIGWGRWPTRPPRRRIQLGAFDQTVGEVRIHPVLDDPQVPLLCLRFVVFHEYLHAALELPAGESAHGPSFRRTEAAFGDAEPASAWIDQHSSALVERVARRVRARRRRTDPKGTA
ncbi:MAG: hypothetical protein AAFZ65_10725 [Planctomycetota bacterium]